MLIFVEISELSTKISSFLHKIVQKIGVSCGNCVPSVQRERTSRRAARALPEYGLDHADRVVPGDGLDFSFAEAHVAEGLNEVLGLAGVS